jgi:hypothetical protein
MRIVANIISVIFHPLLIVTYMLIMLLMVNPFLFGINRLSDGTHLILSVFLQTFFLPFFAIFMMKSLGFVTSYEMKDKQERIGPFIATGIFYLWVYWNVANGNVFHTAFTIGVLGATIALFLGFIINLYFKISLHAIGIAGLVALVIITMVYYSRGSVVSFKLPTGDICQISLIFILMGTIAIAGLVGTARLILQAHRPIEVFAGYAVGFLCQFIAWKMVG